ncbi:MAG: hypothetical protein ACYDH4_13070 [Candidatus Cryosericum sp.]
MASIITRDLALYECFRRKLVNYHAVAGSIRPEVEKLAGKTTTINTIVVAITRFSETVERTAGEKPIRALGGARISLASDVVDVTIRARKTEQYEIAKRIGELSPSLSEPIRMFQLSNSIKLIADEREYDSQIRASLEKFEITKETTALSRLDIHLSPAAEVSPEFGLFLTELLYRNGIKIRQTYIGEETVLIMSRADGPRAYEVLQAEIDESRATSQSQPEKKSGVGTAELLIDELKGTFNSRSIGRD